MSNAEETIVLSDDEDYVEIDSDDDASGGNFVAGFRSQLIISVAYCVRGRQMLLRPRTMVEALRANAVLALKSGVAPM